MIFKASYGTLTCFFDLQGVQVIMSKGNVIFILLLSLFLVILTSCGGESEDTTGNPKTDTPSASIFVSVSISSSISKFDPSVLPIPFSVTVSFSERVQGFHENDITVTGATLTKFIANSEQNYTIEAIPDGNGSDITFKVPSNAAYNTSGNINTASDTKKIFAIDSTSPSVLITTSIAIFDPSLTPILFTATLSFSEPVEDFFKSDIEVIGATLADFTASSEKVYTVKIRPDDSGSDITVTVPSNATYDASGNGNRTSQATVFATNSQAPIVKISFPPPTSLTDGNTITVRGTAVDTSGIMFIRVNGTEATSTNSYETWEANITLNKGLNTLFVETSDLDLNTASHAAQLQINSVGPELSFPQGIVLDRANNRALVADRYLDAIIAVDLDSGIRSIISDKQTPNTSVPISDPMCLVLDSQNNRVLVCESDTASITAVDLNSGERSTISGRGNPDYNNPISEPKALALDSENNRLLLIDDGFSQLLSVDLSTGARTLISGRNYPDSSNKFGFPTGIVFDRINNRALVTNSNRLFSVDLTTGIRTIFSDMTTSDVIELTSSLEDMVLDEENNRVLIVDRDGLIISIDTSTGTGNIITHHATPDTGNQLISPRGLALDSENNRVLVVDADLNTTLSVDLTSGIRTKISSSSTPDEINFFTSPASLVKDDSNNRYLVIDNESKELIAVDMTSGARTIISSPPEHYVSSPTGMVLDGANNRVDRKSVV